MKGILYKELKKIVTDILFKAKCKDKDMWVEGFYFNMPDKTRHYEESWRKDIIPVGSYIASQSPDGLEIHEVDPITVCIWTGIEDWKGKKYGNTTFSCAMEIQEN